MKNLSRFLAMCLILAVSCGMILPAAAEQSETPEAVQWALEGGVLWIRCDGAMTFPDGEIPWQALKSEIAELRMDDGLTEIPPEAFAECSGLRSVTLPAGLELIGADAFRNCSQLYWVTLPESVTYIGDGAFRGCRALKNVFFPGKVGAIGADAFDKTVRITGKSESAAEEYARLKGCEFAPNGVHTPRSDGGSCGKGMFWTLEDGLLIIAGQGALEPEKGSAYPWESHRSDILAVTVEEGITSIGSGAFRTCRKLTEVNLPESLMSVAEDAFRGCSALETVLLPEALKSLDANAFDSNVQLITAEEAKSLDASAVSGEAAAPEAETEPEETQPAKQEEPVLEPETAAEVVEEKAPDSGEISEREDAATGEGAQNPDEKPEAPGVFSMILCSRKAIAGGNTELMLSVENNPGIYALGFDVRYDPSVLELQKVCPGTEEIDCGDLLIGRGEDDHIIWVCPDGFAASGEMLTLSFRVAEDAPEAEAEVKITGISAVDGEENLLQLPDIYGVVQITPAQLGDLNCDGEITEEDSILLRAALAGMMELADAANGDLNGDGKLDLRDALRMAAFLKGECEAAK